MSERWFSDEELAEMSRPTMERAIEAIDAGDLEEAKRALRGDEARVAVHARPARRRRRRADLVRQGEARRRRASRRRGSTRSSAAGASRSRRSTSIDRKVGRRGARRDLARALDQRRRARSPGAFEIAEDDEKLTFTMNPCGSGQRLWRNRPLRARRLGRDRRGARLELRREGFPLYCTHCAFMNETLPIRWIGHPVYPSDPPEDFDRDPCTWYWYKDPADIPERHFERHGLEPRRLSAPGAGSASARSLAEVAGEDPGELELSAIEGGASRETFLVEADGEPRWVLRRDPPGGMSFDAARGRAAAVDRGGRSAGVPVRARRSPLRAGRRALRRPARAT